jgi:tRNA-specific 2-thiouridylase
MQSNTLWVVQGHDHPWLLSQRLDAQDASWISGTCPDVGHIAAKTRYRQNDATCNFETRNCDEFSLAFTQMQWAITPGQSAVIYRGDMCLGGGFITAQ